MGSDLGRWGSYLEWLCSAVVPKKILDTQPDLLVALKTNSETLQVIHREFADIMQSFHIFFFHEAKPTDMKGTFQFVGLRRIKLRIFADWREGSGGRIRRAHHVRRRKSWNSG